LLQDLDTAELAFPDRKVDITIRRYELAQEMKKVSGFGVRDLGFGFQGSG